jgi:hypothetical protein
MTQGIFILGRRPKSKKEIKEYVVGVNRYLDIMEMEVAEGKGIDDIREDLLDGDLVHPDGEVQDPHGLVIEATSLFGNEFEGSLAKALRSITNDPTFNSPMEGTRFPQNSIGITFVGPDPYTSRNRKFYGQIKYDSKKGRFKVT